MLAVLQENISENAYMLLVGIFKIKIPILPTIERNRVNFKLKETERENKETLSFCS